MATDETNHTVSISTHYCGPPDSGNGGYVCGITAMPLGGSNVEVKLVAPPPLERQLVLERDAEAARLVDGQNVIAVAQPVDTPIDIPADAPPLVGFDDAVAAAERFDVDAYRAGHDFPTCFTCGPDRSPGNGLRIFPAPSDRADRVVWPWLPETSLFDDSGDMDLAVMWAALDCPSGLAWYNQTQESAVLGKLAATISRTPSPGEHLVVTGWTGPAEGRRRPAMSAIHSESGDVLATSRATWVVLTDEQRAAFRSSPSS